MGYSYRPAWITCSPGEWVLESLGTWEWCACARICVCVVVVVMRWQTLKGSDGGHLKAYFLPTSSSDVTAEDYPRAPLLPKQKLKLFSATWQKLGVEYLSIRVLEHLHCKTKNVHFGFGTLRGFSSLGNCSMQATEETAAVWNHCPVPPLGAEWQFSTAAMCMLAHWREQIHFWTSRNKWNHFLCYKFKPEDKLQGMNYKRFSGSLRRLRNRW